jgi:hypothetical protein
VTIVRTFIAQLPAIFPMGPSDRPILVIATAGSSRFGNPGAATGGRTVVQPISRY